MSHLSQLRSFLAELKRRKVYRAAAAYLAAAFVGLEALDLLVPATTLPAWAPRLFVGLAILGFPVVLVAAWAFELTGEGMRRTERSEPGMGAPRPGEPEGGGRRNRLLGGILAGLVLLVAAAAGAWYLTGAGTLGAPEVADRSIAVLPFETMGSDAATAFTDGVHGDLLTRLSSLSGLSVTSRTSVMQYRRPEKSLPVIARRLGVAWILHGEVQEAAGRVQVHARLVDARTDRQVWAESYRRELTAAQLFEIQGEITRRIAGALETRLSPEEERRVARVPTESLEAYRLYAQGRDALDRRTEAGMRRAVDFFREAIARDSTYARAWAGLGDALGLLVSYGHAGADPALPEAGAAVRRALELDPESAEAHASLGLLRYLERDGEGGIRELERAVELRPSYAEAHNWLSYTRLLLGRSQEALEAARRAVELDPLSPEAVSNLALSWLMNGSADSALVEARRVRELAPSWATGAFYEALSHYRLGHLGEAESLLRDLSVPWAGAGPAATLALVHAASGDTARARELLDGLDPRSDPFAVGLVRAGLGEVEAAFAALDRVEEWSDWRSLAVHGLYPEVLARLREDRRYAELRSDAERAWGT